MINASIELLATMLIFAVGIRLFRGKEIQGARPDRGGSAGAS